MGVKPGASHADLIKAYRKKSKEIHPDKAKRTFIADRSKPPKQPAGSKTNTKKPVGRPPSDREVQAFVKKATERFATLATVAEVLKGPGRERYDHFVRHGFPRWKGTGYYYSRFRPGLSSVVLGLFVALGGGAHYGALVLAWKRQVEFVDRYIRHARQAAWGDELGIKGIGLDNGAASSSSAAARPDDDEDEDVAAPTNRRQKRMMDRGNRKEKKTKAHRAAATAASNSGTPTGEKKRVVAENGKVLIVDAVGNVFLEEEDEEGNTEQFLLDPSEIQRPTMRDTVLYRLPVWAFRKSLGRVFGAPPSEERGGGDALAEGEEEVLDETAPNSSEEDLVNIPTPPPSNTPPSSGQGAKKKKSKSKKR